MDRNILSLASEKGIIVANECLKNGIEINTLKLQYLLILMQLKMLSQYNKPFFNENIVIANHYLFIEEVNKDLIYYALEFNETLEEYITLLEIEEDVMKDVLETYGYLDAFDLKELPVLKKLCEFSDNEEKKNIIFTTELEKIFNDFYCKEEKFRVITAPCNKKIVVTPEKTDEFKNYKPNHKVRKK